jgi:hypothetical protein
MTVTELHNGGTRVFVQQPAARIEDRTILCKLMHILQVPGRESLHFWKFVNQIEEGIPGTVS